MCSQIHRTLGSFFHNRFSTNQKCKVNGIVQLKSTPKFSGRPLCNSTIEGCYEYVTQDRCSTCYGCRKDELSTAVRRMCRSKLRGVDK